MKALEPPDRHYLLAAEGWLELGNEFEAFMELEKISQEFSGHPEVQNVRRRLYGRTKDWTTALNLAKAICQLEPNHLFSRIHQAYGFAPSKRDSEATDITPAAPIRLPHLFAVPYNLACYACLLGNLEEAWEWLKMAIEMTDLDEIRKLALNDLDLEPLWGKIGEI